MYDNIHGVYSELRTILNFINNYLLAVMYTALIVLLNFHLGDVKVKGGAGAA